MSLRKFPGSRGFTLLEVMISSIIMLVVVTIVYLLLFASSTEEANQQAKVRMDQTVLQVLNVITEDIRNGGGTFGTTLPPASGGGTAFTQTGDALYASGLTLPRTYCLSFFRNTGFSASGTGSAQFNTQIYYFWESAFGETANNGTDDNRDGLVDEGNIIRLEITGANTVRTTIARSVSNRGLAFEVTQTGPSPYKSIRVLVQLMGLDGQRKLITAQSQTYAGPRS